MNTHQIWLQQLQDSVDKRRAQGHLTAGEINQKQFEVHKSIQEQPEQLDELLPALLPLAMPLARMAGGALLKKVAKKAVTGVAANAVTGNNPTEEVKNQLELDRIMEEIAYEMVQEFEEKLGRRLLPEEIEEFVENNYASIQEKADAVTANAHPGDKNTGVGATKPVEPMKTEGGSLKAKAAKFNPKSVGSEGY